MPWAQFAVSVFNTILLLWLGLTVLLNAEKRSWGTYLASGGLLLGGAFFLAHSIALDFSLEALLDGSPYWWSFFTVPLLCLPYGWLILMIWSCGFWDEGSRMHRRARWPLLFSTGCFVTLCCLCYYSAPRNGALPYGELTPANATTYMGARVIALVYPLYLIICTAAALYVVANPARAGKMMSQEARRRARPWLLASSLVQFLVSVGSTCALYWIGYVAYYSELYNVYSRFAFALEWADLVVQIAIAIAVMLLGKAVVSYEIFTGKILPRRGFWRQWRAIVTLAAFYSSVLAASFSVEIRTVYLIMFITALMSIFLAIFSYRAYADRERAVTNLAPFVASQHLTEGLLSGATRPLQRALDEPFRALCEDVLNAGRAVLIARGPHSSLAGAPRLYPPSLPFNPIWGKIVAEADPIVREVTPLPDDCDMNYLVPLGESQNPLGALLLGPRRDGALYTLEEIEVARAAGEHLLDSQAGATLAVRLVDLQRQKLAQVQVLDRHARRVLHDDILPLVHGALLELSATPGAESIIDSLSQAHRGISDLLRETPPSTSPLASRDFWTALTHEIEEELAGAFDEVVYEVSDEARQFTVNLPPLVADTLYFAAREATRNAAKYGRGGDRLRRLNFTVNADVVRKFRLELLDDGVGLGEQNDETAKKSEGGSGSGLALHAAMLAIAGGGLH
ncbi:hypothetical protein EON80_12290, partial [bacterium]